MEQVMFGLMEVRWRNELCGCLKEPRPGSPVPSTPERLFLLLRLYKAPLDTVWQGASLLSSHGRD